MKVRRIRISALLFILITVLLIVGDIFAAQFIFTRSKGMIDNMLYDNALSMSDIIANSVNPEDIAGLQNGDFESDEYLYLYNQLNTFAENSDLDYAYVLRPTGDGEFECVGDGDSESVTVVGEIYPSNSTMFEVMETGKSSISEPYTDEWGTHISAYSPIYLDSNVVGLAVVDLSVELGRILARNMATVIILIFLIIFILVVIALSVISLHIKKSFIKLNNKILDLTDGSGDLTKQIDIKSGDEFEVIAENINNFTEEIRELVQSISNTSAMILSGGEKLNETVDINTDNIYEMNQTLSNLSSNMQECSTTSLIASNTLSRFKDYIESFAKELEEIKNNTEEESVMALDAAMIAEEHRQSADITISSLKEGIAKASEDAKAIEEVSKITAQINDIASQTRMLSLNAQIEAARAGEQGKGFAVVATNVQELSHEIDDAVKEISVINDKALMAVRSLLSQTQEMTRFMEENVTDDYDSFAKLGNQYGSSTEAIKESMTRLGEESRNLLDSITEINSSIAGITTSVTDSAANVSQVASASKSISSSMEDLANVSADNSRESELLNENISKYHF